MAAAVTVPPAETFIWPDEALKKEYGAVPTDWAAPIVSVPPIVTAPPASFRIALARDNAPVADNVALETRPIVLEALLTL